MINLTGNPEMLVNKGAPLQVFLLMLRIKARSLSDILPIFSVSRSASLAPVSG
jgi:hypothetical protein